MSLRAAAGIALFLPALLIPQQPAGEIRGTVIDQLKSVPLHSANVELRGAAGFRRIVQVGAAGYRITGLPAGIYDLTISGSFLRPATVRSIRLQAGENRALPPVQMVSDVISCGARFPVFLRPLDRLNREKASLSGAVVDDHGQPLVRARISISGRGTAVTDDIGRFSLDDVPAHDRFDVELAHDGYYTEDVTDFRVQTGYEAVYAPEHLVACGKDLCDPALRPVRPVQACSGSEPRP